MHRALVQQLLTSTRYGSTSPQSKRQRLDEATTTVGKTALPHLLSMMENQYYHNMTIKVVQPLKDDTDYNCNSWALALASAHFRTFVETPVHTFDKTLVGETPVKLTFDIPLDSLTPFGSIDVHKAVTFAHMGNVNIENNRLLHVWHAANYLRMDTLQHAIADVLTVELVEPYIELFIDAANMDDYLKEAVQRVYLLDALGPMDLKLSRKEKRKEKRTFIRNAIDTAVFNSSEKRLPSHFSALPAAEQQNIRDNLQEWSLMRFLQVGLFEHIRELYWPDNVRLNVLIAGLSGLGKLKSLGLSAQLINDVSSITLFNALTPNVLNSLERLELCRNRIDDDGFSAFATAVDSGALPLLKGIDLSLNQIGDGGVSAFAKAIDPKEGKGTLLFLTLLDLSQNEIGDAGLTSFATALGSGALPLLTDLSLAQNQIGNAGVTALAEAIDPKEGKGALPYLTTLLLFNNQIGDDGLSSFATAIGNGALANITHLQFNLNKIGDAGLTALATAVANGALSNLKALGLSGNLLGDAGCVSLATTVGKGTLPLLTELNLRDNQIGDLGLSSLAAAFASGALPLLTNLEILNNPGDNSFFNNF